MVTAFGARLCRRPAAARPNSRTAWDYSKAPSFSARLRLVRWTQPRSGTVQRACVVDRSPLSRSAGEKTLDGPRRQRHGRFMPSPTPCSDPDVLIIGAGPTGAVAARSRCGRESIQQCARRNHFHAERFFQFQQVRIAADDELRFRRQGTGEIWVVTGIARALFS